MEPKVEPKVGQFVIYTIEVYDGRGVPGLVDYPGLLYKIHRDVLPVDMVSFAVGLYVFTDEGIKHMRKIFYSKDQRKECWRYFGE